MLFYVLYIYVNLFLKRLVILKGVYWNVYLKCLENMVIWLGNFICKLKDKIDN